MTEARGTPLRTLSFVLIIQVLCIVTAMPQEPSTAQPYVDSDAYQIYSLLLSQEKSYVFAKGTLIIREETSSNASSIGACLSPELAKQFKEAISDYERSRKKTGYCSGTSKSKSHMKFSIPRSSHYLRGMA